MFEEIGYIGWLEKKGTEGEAKVLIIPLDEEMREIIEENFEKLAKILKVTQFSEEWIQFEYSE